MSRRHQPVALDLALVAIGLLVAATFLMVLGGCSSDREEPVVSEPELITSEVYVPSVPVVVEQLEEVDLQAPSVIIEYTTEQGWQVAPTGRPSPVIMIEATANWEDVGADTYKVWINGEEVAEYPEVTPYDWTIEQRGLLQDIELDDYLPAFEVEAIRGETSIYSFPATWVAI